MTAGTDTFCDRNLAKKIYFLAIYHLWRYSQGIAPSEGVKMTNSRLRGCIRRECLLPDCVWGVALAWLKPRPCLQSRTQTRGLHGPKFHSPARPDKISARPGPFSLPQFWARPGPARPGPARPVNMWARPGRGPVVASWWWSVVTEKSKNA